MSRRKRIQNINTDRLFSPFMLKREIFPPKWGIFIKYFST